MSNYLKKRREELNLSQRDVANKVGVSAATVSRWESGDIENMRRDRIAAYAKALYASPTFIMTGEDETPTPQSVGVKEKALELFSQLNAEQQDFFLAQLQAVADMNKQQSAADK